MSDSDDFFVGWQARPAAIPRRFFIGCAGAFATGMAGMGALLASRQAPVGDGNWDQGSIRNWRGRLVTEPYPMLIGTGPDAATSCYLLACLGKCGVAARLQDMKQYDAVRITGSLIGRGPYRMIATVDGSDWIAPDDSGAPVPDLAPQALGPVRVRGEILDAKCWFGAMRPSEGKVHKACASLCIRSGIAPAVRSETSRAVFVLSAHGGAHRDDLLPLVAERVDIVGQVIRRANLLFLDTPVSSIKPV